MSFSFTTNSEMAFNVYNFIGILDEHAILPSLQVGVNIVVNLEKLTYINSAGVRIWTRWLQSAPTDIKIDLTRCPLTFVKNMNSIRGMINKSVTVRSVYVPYYDEVAKSRKNVLFIRDNNFFADGKIDYPEIFGEGKIALSPDVDIEQYFTFLKL